MTRKEAAELLGVSERTVGQWAKDGVLSVNYVQGKTSPVADFDEAEVRSLKESREVPSSNFEVPSSGTSKASNSPDSKAGSSNPTKVGSEKSLAVTSNFGLPTSNPVVVIEAAHLPQLAQALHDTITGVGVSLQELSVKPLLTFAEAAILTGLSERTLRQDAKADILPATRIGKADRIYRADLDDYLRAKTKRKG